MDNFLLAERFLILQNSSSMLTHELLLDKWSVDLVCMRACNLSFKDFYVLCKICLKSPCTSISASSAVLAVQGLLRQSLEDIFFHIRLVSATFSFLEHKLQFPSAFVNSAKKVVRPSSLFVDVTQQIGNPSSRHSGPIGSISVLSLGLISGNNKHNAVKAAGRG